MPAPVDAKKSFLPGLFEDHIKDLGFPCVGAKAAVAREQMQILVARDITSAWDDLRIHGALCDFVRAYRAAPRLYQSFVVIFEGPAVLTEAEFEHHLWARLQSLADKDAWRGYDYDREVSADPASPHFSLSFGEEGFFAVGLHPLASRPARRFRAPAVVFNLHAQFDELRAGGLYEKLRASILERDLALSGSSNPMVARHGEVSEARQYSGRRVEDDWRCPLRADAAALGDAA
ncbi:MAG: YqcI/YcgG family protein [Caulobacteraceae bacterium]|nr:YqcI/YcgG family protein [Caulobacteraceae bacterium]